MKIVFLLGLLVGVSLGAPQSAPSWLKNIFEGVRGSDEDKNEESAPYEVIRRTEEYEERSYPATNWVCTKLKYETPKEMSSFERMTSMFSRSNPNNQLFWRLFKYIQGENDKFLKIDMTKPVRQLLVKDEEYTTNEMCFYLGEKHQENPPKPVEETVYVKADTPMTVYAANYTGYSSDDRSFKVAENLQTVLQKEGITVSLNAVYNNVYQSPMKFWDRRNDVLLTAP